MYREVKGSINVISYAIINVQFVTASASYVSYQLSSSTTSPSVQARLFPLSCHAHDQTSFHLAFILQQTLDTSSQPFFPLSDPPSSATIRHDEMATYK